MSARLHLRWLNWSVCEGELGKRVSLFRCDICGKRSEFLAGMIRLFSYTSLKLFTCKYMWFPIALCASLHSTSVILISGSLTEQPPGFPPSPSLSTWVKYMFQVLLQGLLSLATSWLWVLVFFKVYPLDCCWSGNCSLLVCNEREVQKLRVTFRNFHSMPWYPSTLVSCTLYVLFYL